MSKEKGFSLIEILVGISIVITATTVVLSMLVSSFRISNKTTTSSALRQNGNYALNQISRRIQFAEAFNGGRNSTSQDFDPSACTSTRRDFNQISIRYNGVDQIISCSGTTIQIDGRSSIDTSKARIVSGTCNLSCEKETTDSPLIGIEFDLESATGSDLVEESSVVEFSTTVKMRNL